MILAFTCKYHIRNVRLVSFEDLNLDINPSTLWVLLQGEIVMNILGLFDIFISLSHSFLIEKYYKLKCISHWCAYECY